MPKLSDHHASNLVKILNVGDSGAGKTGALTSLVAAGYKVHVLDLDNGLDVLKAYVMKDCPDKVGNIDYETLRDKIEPSPLGPIIKGIPKAYTGSLNLLNKWSDGTIPAEWGPEHIMVIDTLTGLGNAAYNWAKAMSPNAKEPRQWYHTAQQGLEQVISLATSAEFKTNLIINAHIDYREGPDGMMKGYANSVGKAIGPVIPSYFNTVILTLSKLIGKDVKRTVNTVPTSMLDLKNPAPFRIEASFPLETGLATLFQKLKDQNNA
jgi:hypothetical protein